MIQRQLCIWIFVVFSVSLVRASWIKRSDEDYAESENDAPSAPTIPGERNNETGLGNCALNQFRCDDGECIALKYKCDDEDDCEDNSDESEELCSWNTCDSTQFFCPRQRYIYVSAKCIPLESVCDKARDCPGGEDEWSCPCSEDEFKCPNGICIPNSNRCDGLYLIKISICGCTYDDNCGDAEPSDESEEYCSVNRCNSTEFYCPWDGRQSKCIPLENVCNRRRDCRNGEDEKSCECVESEFKCPNGICVPNESRCDGINDCLDEERSDEAVEYCSVNRCNSTEYFCTFPGYPYPSQCIPLESVCDKNQDCYNGEDEKSCPCTEDEFKCPNGECIPNRYTCDGDNDCQDENRSDESEEYCSVNRCNSSTEFFCPWDGRGSKCVRLESVCNGINDCANGDDEKSCPCRDDQFRCDNGKCIISKFRCDQEDDCDDNSDEVGCENAGKSGNSTADCRRVKFESKNPEIDIVIAVDTDVGDCLEEINGEEGGTSETKTSNSHKTAQVIVYKYTNRQGDRETMELVRGRCSNVPPGYNDQIESIDNLGNCVILYEHSDCVGESAKLRPKSTFIAEDLARIKMKNYISSLEMC